PISRQVLINDVFALPHCEGLALHGGEIDFGWNVSKRGHKFPLPGPGFRAGKRQTPTLGREGGCSRGTTSIEAGELPAPTLEGTSRRIETYLWTQVRQRALVAITGDTRSSLLHGSAVVRTTAPERWPVIGAGDPAHITPGLLVGT